MTRLLYAAIGGLLLWAGLSGCGNRDAARVEESRDKLETLALKINTDFSLIRMEVKNLAGFIEKVYENRDAHLAGVDRSLYETTENGAFYKHTDDGGAALWVSGHTPLTPEIKEIALFTEAVDPELIRICDAFPEVVQAYYNDRHSLNRIYPFFDVLTQYEPRMNIPAFNFYYLADAAHNPERKALWVNEPYVDPAGRGWMVSAVAPVYRGEETAGVPGLDVTINTITDRYINEQDRNIMLLDGNGVVVAAHAEMIALFSLAPLTDHRYMDTIREDTYRRDDYSLLKSRSREIRAMARRILEKGERQTTALIDDSPRTILAAPVPELGWILCMLL